MRIQVAEEGEERDTAVGPATIVDFSIVKHRGSGKIYVRYLYEGFLQKLAVDMHKNIQDGYDNVVVVEGPEGSGKSNLAYQLCRQFDPTFDMSDQYVYNTDAFKDKLREGDDQHSIFWMDEGSNIANNRDWNTEGNKNLVSLLETMRSRGWTIVMCIPHYERLDVYIRENRIRYLIKCEPMSFNRHGHKDRGYFELRKKDQYGQLRSAGYGTFERMDPDAAAEYKTLKLASQDRMIRGIVDGEQSGGSKYRQKYEEQCKKENKMLYSLYKKGVQVDDLMNMFSIDSDQTFRNKICKGKKLIEGENS